MWGILPVKPFAAAKRRLGAALDAPARRRLARIMFEHTLDALLATPEIEGVVVVSADRAVRNIARDFGARVIDEGWPRGHNAAVAMAARRFEREGVARILTVPSDLPQIQPAELSAVIEALPAGRGLVLVVSRSGAGTNCLAVSPPSLVDFRFGGASLRAHLEEASRVDVRPVVLSLAGFGLDVDEPEDLAALLPATEASRTRTWLANHLKSRDRAPQPARSRGRAPVR